MSPEISYQILVVVQALHLLHHRLAKRHISFAEVASTLLLCIPPALGILPPVLLTTAHLGAAAVQVVGSVALRRLSPDWERERSPS